MKLATYKDGSRDGQLVVVSRDLTTAHYATAIASRLQQALDDWNFISPQLQDLYDALNQGKARHAFAFDAAQCMAPLPRAFQRLQAEAYLDRLALQRQAAGQGELPERLRTEPWMRQGGGDAFLGPRDDLQVADEAFGIDFGAGLAALIGDVPMAATPEQGLDAVRLLVLANVFSLHALLAEEAALGGGPLQGEPAVAFGPVAVTPDELGEAWQQGRVHLPLQTTWNGRKFGLCDAGASMHFGFGQLIAHAARTRRLGAGTLVGAGVVSQPGTAQDGQPDWPRGHASIADRRAVETLRDGQPETGYLRLGDTVRVEMKGRGGEPLLGAIEQVVRGFGVAATSTATAG